VGEALAGVKVMNKVIGLGMPVRQAVNEYRKTSWGLACPRLIGATRPPSKVKQPCMDDTLFVLALWKILFPNMTKNMTRTLSTASNNN
jgi:hypothetical protein